MSSSLLSQAVLHDADHITDTHCHYNLESIWPNWQEHWQAAQAAGVVASWIPGTSVESSQRAVEIARTDSRLKAFIGVHPSDDDIHSASLAREVSDLRALFVAERDLAAAEQRANVIIGIGEIGLDYFRVEPDEFAGVREAQVERLQAQLALAKELDLMVSLHVRDKELPDVPTEGNAYWDVLTSVRAAHLSQPVILHCVSGPLPYVRAMLELGAYVSFAGNVTYPSAQALRDILALTPQERRLVETDAPYLAPKSQRGKPCEPRFIRETAEFVLGES